MRPSFSLKVVHVRPAKSHSSNLLQKPHCNSQEDQSQIAHKHQDLYIKETKISCYTWMNDGQNGKTDPLHSENVLLTWLNNGKNFSKWRDPEGAKIRLAVTADLVFLLKSNGCHFGDYPIQVKAKINHIESLIQKLEEGSKQVNLLSLFVRR